MDPRKPPEYILEVFADPTSVRDVVKGERSLSETDAKFRQTLLEIAKQ